MFDNCVGDDPLVRRRESGRLPAMTLQYTFRTPVAARVVHSPCGGTLSRRALRHNDGGRFPNVKLLSQYVTARTSGLPAVSPRASSSRASPTPAARRSR